MQKERKDPTMNKDIQELIAKINSKDYGKPTLSGHNLNRLITPEVGWLLSCMEKRASTVIMTTKYPQVRQNAQNIMLGAIKTITQEGRAARRWNKRGRTAYYKELARHALRLEKLGKSDTYTLYIP